MPAWPLSGSLLLALSAPAAGDGVQPVVTPAPKLRIVDIAHHDSYRMPLGGAGGAIRGGYRAAVRDRRIDRSQSAEPTLVADPQGDSVRQLLRDRMARRGAPLDARVEFRLSRDRSDLGLAGGLKRVVDTLLHD